MCQRQNIIIIKCNIYHLFIFHGRISLKMYVFFSLEVLFTSAFKIDFQSKTIQVFILESVVTAAIASYQYWKKNCYFIFICLNWHFKSIFMHWLWFVLLYLIYHVLNIVLMLKTLSVIFFLKNINKYFILKY